MATPSTIARLPAEIREKIGQLRGDGRTIDEILAKLTELDVDVSRSALGRHIKQLDAIGEEIRRSRGIAEQLVQRFGEAPEGRVARLNIELMHGLVMKLLVAEDGQPVTLDSKDAFFIGSALQKLAQAGKLDVDREAVIESKFRAKVREKAEEAAAAIAKAGAEKGLSKDAIEQFRKQVLGIAT